MPIAITDVNQFDATINTVADGDGASGANFAIAPQGLANRTRNLKNRLDAIVAASDNGVRAFRFFTTIAALQASTDHNDTQVAMVIANGGLYQYVAASTATAATNLVITPNDVGAGAGRWLLLSPAGVPNGLATLDANSKIPAASVPMRLVAAPSATLGSTQTNTTTTIADVSGLSLSLSVVAGDIVSIQSCLNAYASSTSYYNDIALYVVDGGSTNQVSPDAKVATVGAGSTILNLGATYTVTTTGTLVVKPRFFVSSAGGTAYVGSASTLSALQYRP